MPSLQSFRPALLLSLLLLNGCNPGNPEPLTTALPTIDSFTVTPNVSNAGRLVQVKWASTGASQLLLFPGAIDVTGRTRYNLVVPPGTTALMLQASNAIGSVTQPANLRAYDWSSTAATLDASLGGTAVKVDGYSFIALDRAGELFRKAGGDIAQSEVVQLASASKLPTVMTILSLVDAGKLALDTPVGTYFSTLDPTFIWPADKAAITLRMLLSHSSGLPGLSDNSKPACLGDETGGSLRACAQDIANTALVSPPGTAFNYGGTSFQLAAYLAVLVSQRPSWQVLFQERIAIPLALTRFSYGDPATVTNPLVAGSAAGDSVEYSRFLLMLLNDGVFAGRRVLSTAMVGEILRNQVKDLPVVYSPFPDRERQNYQGYGMGVFLSATSLHPGSSGPEFSDPGLLGTTPWIDRGLGYAGVLVIDKTTVAGIAIWNQLRPEIIRQLTQPPT